MRRLLFGLIAATALAAPLSADALRLAAPHQGAVLRGGSFTALSWTAASLPPHAEEWEAFLSIDGGRYYGFRVTPHLDIDLRRFEFVVPNVDSNDVRILIRFGDERRETLVELPARFSIARDPSAELPLAIGLSPRAGEAARPGDPGVVGWAEGDRAATRVAQRSAAGQSSSRLRATPAGDAPQSLVTSPKSLRARSAPVDVPLGSVERRLAAYAAQQVPPSNLLLVCRRRNI